MIKLFRQLIAALSGLFFKLIPDLYDIFYDLSRARFFTDDTIRRLAGNIYILVSVVMLFTFSVQLIKAIVNPDTLFDSKKGTGAFVKRCALAIVMITAVPILFNEMFILQDTIITNNLIEKVVVGYSGDSSQLRIGQYLAASSLEEVLYPEEGVQTSDPMLQTNYDLMLNNDIKTYYDLVVDDISEKDNDIFVLHYEPLVAVLISVFVCYMLVTTCMDMAVRMVKLELLQLIAPISIIAYIIKEKDNSLEKWFSEVAKTYALVFIKIAALIFGVFILQHLPDFFNRNQDFSHPWIIKLLVIIAIFTIINELPNLIQSLFGVEFKFKGGIGGRLGQMAIVGNMAQKAWNQVNSPAKAIGTTAGLAAGAVSGVGGAISHGYAAVKKGREDFEKSTDIKGKALAIGGGVLGVLSMGGAARRAATQGYKNRNLSGIGSQYQRYNETHPEGSTLGGRIYADARRFVGLNDSQKAMEDSIRHQIATTGVVTNPLTGVPRSHVGEYEFVDESGATIIRHYDENQYKRDVQAIDDRIRVLNSQKQPHTSNIQQYQATADIQKAIKDEAKSKIARVDSSILASKILADGNYSTKMDIYKSDGTVLESGHEFKSTNDIDSYLTSHTDLSDETKNSLTAQKKVLKEVENMNFSQISTYLETLKNRDISSLSETDKKMHLATITAAEKVKNEMEDAISNQYILEAIHDKSKNNVINDKLVEYNEYLKRTNSEGETIQDALSIDELKDTNITNFDELKRAFKAIKDNSNNEISKERTEEYKIDNSIYEQEKNKHKMEEAKGEVDNIVNDLQRSDAYVAAGHNTDAINNRNNSGNSSSNNH